VNWKHILTHPGLWLPRLKRKLQLTLNPRARSVFKLEDGLLFECALGDSVGRILTVVGTIEAEERSFVRQSLQPGEIFFDIGANLGLFTLTAARRVGPAGHVFAFEPSQREARYLQRNLELNRLTNVTIVTQAVSDQIGSARFAIAADGGNNSLMKNAHPQQQIQEWQDVEITTLDAFIAAHAVPQVNLMKIDVEGGEVNVLRGAAQLLNGPQPPTILCEFCDVTAAGFNSSGRALYDTFTEFGYQLFKLSEADQKTLLPAPRQERYDYENLIGRKQPQS
jgi:FkbM family methyltransferase